MKINTCPIVHWYKFKKCDINTCKNYTQETHSHCLELDRRKPDGTKMYSDAELNLYKFKERKISTRLVQMYRKEAIDKVKAILVLQKYIVWLDGHFKERRKFKHEELRNIERKYPLKIRRLGWRNWMWEYALNQDVYKRFRSGLSGESSELDVAQVFSLSFEKYQHLSTLTKGSRK
jgi:hypothetical protein